MIAIECARDPPSAGGNAGLRDDASLLETGPHTDCAAFLCVSQLERSAAQTAEYCDASAELRSGYRRLSGRPQRTRECYVAELRRAASMMELQDLHDTLRCQAVSVEIARLRHPVVKGRIFH